MAAASTDEIEWLPRTAGIVPAVIAWVLLGAYAVLTLLDGPTGRDTAPLLLSLTLALLAWVVLVRPRVGLAAESLVLQGTVSRLAVPWARVEDVAIRRALLVFTPDRRYVSPALTRPRRMPSARPARHGQLEPADHLVDRLRSRTWENAEPGREDQPREVRREWDVLVLAALAAAVLASGVAALA